MTVDGIKKRLALFNQYDQMMEKLMKEMNEFRVDSRIVIGEKKEAIKLYGYAFNFAWTLYNSIDICQKYEAEIKNSLFHYTHSVSILNFSTLFCLYQTHNFTFYSIYKQIAIIDKSNLIGGI